MHLVDPTHAIEGDLWWAQQGERRLAGVALPGVAFSYAGAFEHGLTHLISLTGSVHQDCAPLIGVAHELEDLYGQAQPSNPDLEWQRVRTAAAAVRELLDAGHGVLVHCLGGTGRTGTVIGAVLVSYGATLGDVAAWLDAIHHQRGGQHWPESTWQRSALGVLTSS